MTRYEVGYLWVESPEHNKRRIGLSRHGLEKIGDINWISFPPVDEKLEVQDLLFVLESSKAAIDVESPISGKVTFTQECTEALLDSLKDDPDQLCLIELDPS